MRSPASGRRVSTCSVPTRPRPLLRALFDRCHVVAWHPGLPVDAVLRDVVASTSPAGRRPARPAAASCCGMTPSDPAPAEWTERAPSSSLPPRIRRSTYATIRAIAPFMRERWRGRFGIDVPRRDARWPVVAPAAHVPLALPRGRCNRNDRARGACVRHSARHRHVDRPAAGRHRRPRHARLRRRSGKCGCDGESRSARTIEAAAAIGHAGRRLVEARHDLSLRGRRGRSRAPLAVTRVAGARRHLADLPTPPLSRPITRAEARIGELSVA